MTHVHLFFPLKFFSSNSTFSQVMSSTVPSGIYAMDAICLLFFSHVTVGIRSLKNAYSWEVQRDSLSSSMYENDKSLFFKMF